MFLRILERGLLVWLLIMSVVAYSWPAWIAPSLPSGWSFDPFAKAWSDYFLNPLMALTMFAIGWMLPREEVDAVLREWPAVIQGTAIQYTAMPILAWLTGSLLGLPRDLYIGLVIVGCVPGAMASNVLTLAARGNTSYSVMLTSCSTLLSPLAVPLGLWLILGALVGDASVFLSGAVFLLLTVVIPVVAGHLLGRSFPALEPTAKWLGATIANLTILVIIAAVVGSNREKIGQLFAGQIGGESGPWPLLLALVGTNLGGYAAGYFGGWLLGQDEPRRRALTIEIGMQNAGLGALLARQLFADTPAAMVPPALFTFGCMLTGTMLAAGWAWWDDWNGVTWNTSTSKEQAQEAEL